MTGFREVRRGQPGDAAALADVFYRAVHEGAAPKYSAVERKAWAPERPSPEAFADRLAPQSVFVATEDDAPIGFMTLRDDGLVDLAYVLPEQRGTGTATGLLAMLQNHATARGFGALTTRASEMARPFFLRHGWRVLRPATQERDGVVLSAVDMSRTL